MKLIRKFLPAALIGALALQTQTAFAMTADLRPVSTSKKESTSVVSEVTDLTVGEAARLAINNNEAIIKAQENESHNDDRYEAILDTVDELRIAGTEERLFAAYTNQLSFELGRSLGLKSLAAQKENVEHIITQLFNSILNAEEKLKLLDEQIALSKMDLDISNLKLSLGLESQLNYDVAKLNYDKLLSDRSLAQSAIDSAYRKLNDTMGQKLDKKYNLELELEYEEFGEVNLLTYVSKFLAESLSVKQAKDNVQVAKYTLDTFYIADYNSSNVPVNGSGKTKPAVETEYVQALRALDAAEKAVEKSVIDTYNSIKDAEISLKTYELSLQSALAQYEISKKRLELGQITQLTLDKQALEIKTLQNTIRESKNNHTILVTAFTNPNLLTASTSNGE